MSAGGAAMTVTTVRLLCLVTAFGIRTYRRRGYLQSPGLLLVTYAAFRLAYLRRLDGAERYAAAALAWAERVPHPQLGSRIVYLVHAFVYAWTRPRRSVLEPLRQLSESL